MANKFWDDTFEKALEAGQSMAKGGVKQIKQTFNPLQMLKNTAEGGGGIEADAKRAQETLGNKKDGSTPLDFDKLQKSYGNQDEAQAKALANRLFQLVKSGEEKVLNEGKQKEAEKLRQEEYARQDKKRKEAQASQQTAEEPHGKERKSILGGKKKKSSAPATAEVKPSQSKQ